jgi:hypothetical protein
LVRLRALDHPVTTRPTWLRWITGEQLNAVVNASGLSSNDVEAMTLSVYDGTALQLSHLMKCPDACLPDLDRAGVEALM